MDNFTNPAVTRRTKMDSNALINMGILEFSRSLNSGLGNKLPAELPASLDDLGVQCIRCDLFAR
jgi:hypothetical protein